MRHCVFQKIHNRFLSSRGASLAVALLGFLFCATVGSVVLAAASVSMGRTTKPDSDADMQRYSLESAAAFILEEVQNSPSSKKQNEQTFTFSQNWYYTTARADYISLKMGEDGTISDHVKRGSDEYAEGPTIKVGGDAILALDQKPSNNSSADSENTSSNSTSKFLDGTNIPLSCYPEYNNLLESNNNNAFKYQTNLFQAAGQNLNSSDHDVNTNNLTSSISSLQDLRNVCAEQICRHFWWEMAQADPEDANSDQDDSNWGENGTPTARNWSRIVEGKTYSVTMQGVRIEVTSEEGTIIGNKEEGSDTRTIYPVYADVTMDQNFNLTFHLYCGSKEDGTLDDPDAEKSMLNLWVSFPCDDQKTKTAYTTNSSETDSGLNPLYLVSTRTVRFTGSYQSADAPAPSDDGSVKVTVTGPVKENENENDPSQTVSVYTVTTEEKLSGQMHVVMTERGVDLPVTWKPGTILAKAPQY